MMLPSVRNTDNWRLAFSLPFSFHPFLDFPGIEVSGQTDLKEALLFHGTQPENVGNLYNILALRGSEQRDPAGNQRNGGRKTESEQEKQKRETD